jgi:hypothetical protein
MVRRLLLPGHPSPTAEDVVALADAVTESSTSLLSIWQKNVAMLERTGVPSFIFEEVLHLLSVQVTEGRGAIAQLQAVANAMGVAVRLSDASAAINQVERETKAIRTLMSIPQFDPERLRLANQEAERGDAEDAEDILAQVRSGEKG